MYSNGISLNAASYKNVFSTSSGSLCVPVKPSAVIYSQFNYVRGVATKPGEGGVPINKVKILNTLISQLISMKQKPSLSKEDILGLTDSQKDELIRNYQQQIKTALSENSYGFLGLIPEAGTSVSISA